MSAALVLPIEQTAEGVRRKRFTRAEVERLTALGAFEGQRYELIDGDLIDKMGQNPPHARAIRRAKKALAKFVDEDLIQVQAPIEVSVEDSDRSLPEPDLSILREDKPEYDERHPRGNELLLVIEVSDSSAAFDLSRKAALYAKAGVPEYWVLELGRRRLVVHRQPDGAEYRLRQFFSESDTVSLEDRAEIIPVAALLPGTV
jgi:Uma2 family endonuclease